MQTTYALLDAVFGRKKKGVKYLRRLLFGHKACPLTYLHGPGAQEFGTWLRMLAAHPMIMNRASRRQSLYGQHLVFGHLSVLKPAHLEDHLVFALSGQKQVYVCLQQPTLLEEVEDAEVAVFWVDNFELKEILEEIPLFVMLLLKEVDYQGRPASDFSLGI